MKSRELDDIEYFMCPVYENTLLETLKNKSKGDSHYIKPDSIILSKIICGDAGDNIKSVARYVKNGKTFRFSERDWETLSNQLSIKTIDDLIENKETIAKFITSHKKISPYNIQIEDVMEMIDYNIKLVWLNEKVIPETCILAMNNVDYKSYDIDYIRSNYKVLCGNEEESEISKLFETI